MKKMWSLLLLVFCYSVRNSAQIPVSVPETGFSDQYKSENTLGEYTFGYNEDHTTGGSFRRETSDRLGNKFGSYGLRIGDGRVRVVNYVADQNGFRADIFSNEPGVESQHSNPYAKVTKKAIYSILVPGFRYSSVSPHVTFQGIHQPSSFDEGIIDGTADKFKAEQTHYEGEDFNNVYGSENNPTDGFQNEGFDEEYSERQMDRNNAYMNEEVLEDPFLEGDFSQESESVVPNRNSSMLLEQKASDASVEVQNKDAHSASTIVSVQAEDATRNDKMNYQTQQYNHERGASLEDLNPYQSTIVLRKEPAISQNKANATLHEGDNSNNKNVTVSTMTEA